MTWANVFEVLILSNLHHKLIPFFLAIGIVLGADNAVAQNNPESKTTIKVEEANKKIPTKSKMGRKGRRPAPLVIVDTVRQETYSQLIPVIGRFVARRVGVIAAQVNGPMTTGNGAPRRMKKRKNFIVVILHNNKQIITLNN